MVALLGEMEGIEPSARRQGRIPTT
jgi:hypothetical protein